jgi:3-oxoadipate enol-lactonase
VPTVRISDIEMHYETYGDGFPLILIMGFAANKEWWPDELIKNLSNHYKVIIFDNRGAGRSTCSDAPISIKLLAKDTIELLDALDVQQANVFGMSLGGMVAQQMALDYPDRINKLVLGATTCGPIHGRILTLGQFIPTLKSLLGRKFNLDLYLLHLAFSRETRDLAVRRSIDASRTYPMKRLNQWNQLKACFLFNNYKQLKNIHHETLILVGTKDVLIPPKNSEILFHNIPNATLKKLHGMTHVFFADAPDNVYRILVDFLD